jgi:nitrite reductase (NADH) small subunit
MSEFRKIATVQQLPAAGEAQEFPLDDKMLCIANVNGEFCALDNVCPHRGGPLGQGFVAGGKIVCPWHGWEIEVKTGNANGNPAVTVYDLRIEGDDVLVKA